MPKLVSIVLFAGSAVFLILALVLALTRGALDVSVLDYYFVVLPRYLFAGRGDSVHRWLDREATGPCSSITPSTQDERNGDLETVMPAASLGLEL
jgi:hypothetical protein